MMRNKKNPKKQDILKEEGGEEEGEEIKDN